MRTAIQALTVLLPSAYLLAAILHGMAFGGDRAPQVDRPRRIVLSVTLLLHLVCFLLRALVLGHFPVSDVWSTLSAVAMCAAGLFLVVARRSSGERGVAYAGTGGVVLGLVSVLQLIASAFGPTQLVARAGGMGTYQVLHVATSVLAAAALILSGVHGILYLLLYRQMRARRFGVLFAHLPDLDVLARMTRSSALSGFLFLTVGVNVGIAMAHAEKSEGFRYAQPEVLLSIVLWIHFGVIAFSRHIRGFSARRASFAAAGGLVALLLSLMLILFPGISFHSRL
ncbi:MAG TPA: cytochrome c biogenesis protein CcsA [Planctomycetota bacterium]|jgi:ABC-type transport system involved in cytochrome c biogenesis permease subunit|nr:cytochrome c biogenesis protein CcsA [Planctomycetota bacterium]